MSLKDFDNNELLNSAVSFKFIQISENVSKLSEKIKDENNLIPWRQIKGLRNKIVHDYDNVYYDIIFNTIKNDLPDLLGKLKIIFKDL